MPYKDLREFIAQVDDLGALRRIDGADPRFEIGAITEVAAGLPECPALLFDDIKGHARGFRVFTNATTHAQRAALALGIDPTLKPLDALKAWMVKRHTLKARDPVTVTDAAFLENALLGADVDLEKFPAPQWHRQDGGPYIGSGSLVVMRDPDDGWINASIYRVQVHGPQQGHGAVRPPGPARRHHRQEILGSGQALPARGRQRRGSGAIHRRLRISAGGPVGIRFRRRHQGRADRAMSPGRRPGCRCRPTPRSSSKASCCRRAPKRCRKGRSASSPAITPPTSGPAR